MEMRALTMTVIPVALPQDSTRTNNTAISSIGYTDKNAIALTSSTPEGLSLADNSVSTGKVNSLRPEKK
jgi:hypothetical protein